MDDQRKIIFSCRGVPEDPVAVKLLGLYRQRRDELWMQRVKILGGVLTGDQWRTLGQIASELTPTTPLHLTTRQNIELHDITDERVPAVQRALAGANLTDIGACGDTPRNITVCPCSGTARGAVDLFPLAREIRRTLEATEGIFALPRKFKISFSCCRACGQPWINDLGFVVRRKKGQYGFRLIGAGSLGHRPATGIVLFDWLSAVDVLPVVAAAVRVFAAHGDREHRNLARFRHVRERFGNEKFTAVLKDEFEKAKSERTWPEVVLAKPGNEFTSHLTLTFVNGNVTPAASDALAQLADLDEFRIRITNHHRVEVFGRSAKQLREAVAALDPLAKAAEPQAAVVACPGTRWCNRALVDTNQMANRIRAELGGKLPAETTVCISGCPNGCTHSAVADIGLIGALATRGGRKREVFNLSAGGGMGRSDKLAKPVAQGLCPEEIVEEMAKLAAGAT